MEEASSHIAEIEEAALEAAKDGVSSESISSPSGGSRSVSRLTPEQILAGKKAILRDMGADVLARIQSPFVATYPGVIA